MPVIKYSTFQPAPWLGGRHRMTIAPALLRLKGGPEYTRTRIHTPDGDFLDLDFAFAVPKKSKQLVIIQHGLEGSSQAKYVRGMARAFLKQGWDALAWNFRGCSGSMNQQPRTYHSGFTEDLQVVISYVLSQNCYDTIVLVGFSLGGNLTLKYMGEHSDSLPPQIKGAVAFSVPCDLAASSRQLARSENRIYMQRFLKTLTKKAYYLERHFPGCLDISGLDRIRDFGDFDGQVTGPLNGFSGARDYWARSSCRQFLPLIKLPTLLINARTDPFLPPECYPFAEAQQNPYFSLEIPEHGGHVGFLDRSLQIWSEQRTLQFVETRILQT